MLSPCGVPIVVANAWQSLNDRRGSSNVSARRKRFIRISDSPRKLESTSINLSRRMVSYARLKSMPKTRPIRANAAISHSANGIRKLRLPCYARVGIPFGTATGSL